MKNKSCVFAAIAILTAAAASAAAHEVEYSRGAPSGMTAEGDPRYVEGTIGPQAGATQDIEGAGDGLAYAGLGVAAAAGAANAGVGVGAGATDLPPAASQDSQSVALGQALAPLTLPNSPAAAAIPMRASPGQRDILFPDINMFVRVENWDKLAKASHGIVAFKVWQSRVDRQIQGDILANFRENLRQAERHQMIVIGYAFGVGGISGASQADMLLDLLRMGSPGRPIPGRILALDLESNPGGSSMTDAEATAFIRRVLQRTGRYPVLYASDSKPRPGILGKCPRWVADWSGARPRAAFWQFTDGSLGPGPHSFPGVGHCDINKLLITYAAFRRMVGL